MAIGPVDVYIIGFPGNQFTGRIAPALLELVDNGTLRILDLLFVIKDAEGVMASLRVGDLDAEHGASFMSIEIAQPGALDQTDAEEVADDLPLNSSALLVAVENVWARKLTAALLDADAFVIDHVRIPADVVNAVITA